MKTKIKKYITYSALALLLIIYLIYPNFINPVMEPLLKLPRIISIIFLSFVITLVMTLVYKWMTDQTLMKSLKEDQKKYQKMMKDSKSNPKKMMEYQKKAMELNMTYLKESIKPTLITFIPLIIIFSWMNLNLANNPILPGEDFKVNLLVSKGFGEAKLEAPEGLTLLSNETQPLSENIEWNLRAGDKGSYELKLFFNNKNYTIPLVIDDIKYSLPVQRIDKSATVKISYGKWKVFGEKFSIFGWQPGWLATYIVLSLIFSTIIRKIMKVY